MENQRLPQPDISCKCVGTSRFREGFTWQICKCKIGTVTFDVDKLETYIPDVTDIHYYDAPGDSV